MEINHKYMENLKWIEEISSPDFNWSCKKLMESNFKYCLDVELEEIMAFIAYVETESALEVMALATHPRRQSSGKMKKLLRSLIETQRNNLPIWLEVHEQNLKALNLYEKLGFLRVGRRPNYYKDGGAAILMERAARQS